MEIGKLIMNELKIKNKKIIGFCYGCNNSDGEISYFNCCCISCIYKPKEKFKLCNDCGSLLLEVARLTRSVSRDHEALTQMRSIISNSARSPWKVSYGVCLIRLIRRLRKTGNKWDFVFSYDEEFDPDYHQILPVEVEDEIGRIIG